ncbi:GNAT family N-acetyltransferase [Curtobacterium sp. PhB136]|uniref:GNAT family N-acetyltransferase n=1 Tax=Curtobacterium sp. PhB136 TaxID=2485181 RepID=UPI00104D0DD4|nr:GNAT family N-acetyltransferase [Curtobacterium sp. PhB136]TCK64603.1 RimJ/RimL family protein N-acetyltransferase [Curtobacterium sp. PhB136]
MPVSLRPWSRSDGPALLAARWSSPDLDTQFTGADLSDEAQAADYIGNFLPFSDTAKNWAVIEDGIAVGNVGLSAIETRHQTAWAYYWLAGGARGRGYASRALQAVADWAFDAGLFRLELGHRVNNPASCRVATAAGFLKEGTERQKLRYGTERFDVETHARLASDPHTTTSALAFETAR